MSAESSEKGHTAPAVCSKRLGRGKCKREVVFYAEFFGGRENACVVHLGEILLERGITPSTRAVVFLRATPASDERPHSRACGITQHDHGPRCHSNCPTCGTSGVRTSPPAVPTKSSGEPIDLLAALQRSVDAARSDARSTPGSAGDPS